MEDFASTVAGSWQDWLFVAGYVSLLLFVVGMVIGRSSKR
jgi:hypothetical protein